MTAPSAPVKATLDSLGLDPEVVYRAVAESVNYGVWVYNADGGLVWLSESYLQMLGATLEELPGLTVAEQFLHPDDHDRVVAEWLETVRTGTSWDCEYRVRAADGSWQPILSKGVPIRDHAGTIVAWAGVHLDVADRLAAETQLAETLAAIELVLDVAPSFHSDDSYEATAASVCRSAREMFGADSAALWQVGDDSGQLLVRDPPSDVLVPGTMVSLDAMPGVADHARQHRPGVLRVDAGDDLGAAEVMSRTGTVSAVYAALGLPDGSRANLTLAWTEPTGAPGPAQLVAVQRFADLAALGLAQAHRRANELSAQVATSRLQAALLPKLNLGRAELALHSRYQPGERRLLVGGDFYDAIEVGGVVHLVVGDVAGHGPDAAALGANLRAGFRTLSLSGQSCVEALAGISRLLRTETGDEEAFATACCATVDPVAGTVSVALAGHPPPVLLLATGGARIIDATVGPPLGVGTEWESSTSALPAGAAMLMYTDGLIEGRAEPGAAERLGIEEVLRHPSVASGPPWGPGLLDELIAAAVAGNGGPLDDDVALLLLQPVVADGV